MGASFRGADVKTQYATIIEPSGETRELRPGNLKEFTLEELQGFVGGNIDPELFARLVA